MSNTTVIIENRKRAMSDFWWQVQQQEEEQWQEMLDNDPGYQQWLDHLNKQTMNGGQITTNTNYQNERK